jgi:hypothetical protein
MKAEYKRIFDRSISLCVELVGPVVISIAHGEAFAVL